MKIYLQTCYEYYAKDFFFAMTNFRYFVFHVKEIKENEYFREKSVQENILT